MLQAIDRLLGSEKPAAVLEITESMIRKDPHDWEALYREGLALADLGKKDDAAQRFRSAARPASQRRRQERGRQGPLAQPEAPVRGLAAVELQPPAAAPARDRVSAASPGPQGHPARDPGHVQHRDHQHDLDARRTSARPAWPPWAGSSSLSRDAGKAKEDAVLAEFRAAKDKVPHDPRALWDWYYLNLALGDNTATYEAARDLSRAAAVGPDGAVGLPHVAGEPPVRPGSALLRRAGDRGERRHAPLPADEIDHVLASYRALRQRRPELAARQILGSVAVELKRAKRADDADALYREAVDGARQVDEVASVFGLAGERGDVDGLIALLDKYERLQAGRASSAFGTYYYRGPGLFDVAGHERPRRGQGLRRRAPPARPLSRRRPPQARAGRPGARPLEQLRQSLRRGQHAELSDLVRPHAEERRDQLPAAERVLTTTAPSRCCGRPTSSTRPTT